MPDAYAPHWNRIVVGPTEVEWARSTWPARAGRPLLLADGRRPIVESVVWMRRPLDWRNPPEGLECGDLFAHVRLVPIDITKEGAR